MQMDDATDAELAPVADFQSQIVAALEGNRRLGYTRNRDGNARPGRKFGYLDFADVGRKVYGTCVHSLGDRLVDEVDDECASLTDVLERILRRAVRPRLDAEDDEGRIPAEYIEKRERRRVYNAVLTDGGDERDRARHHERGQELVAMRYRKRAEITSNGAVMQLLPGRRNVSGRVGDAAVALEAPTTRNRRTNLVHTFT